MKLKKHILQNKYLYLMILPALIFMVIFRYVPMGGLIIAFKNYSFRLGIWNSPWVGLRHFVFVFTRNLDFFNILRNTLVINLLKLLFYFPAPIILALMINDIRSVKLKRGIQTAVYLPYFISWVVFGTIVIQFLSPSTGIANKIIRLFGGEPVFFIAKSEYIWGIVVLSEIWKSAGWGTIMYLAALTSIDPELYQAAKIDGANHLQCVWHISLPGISDTIVVLLLLQIGQMMDVGFDQMYVLAKPIVYDVGDVLSTYIFRVGVGQAQFSQTAVIGLFQSVVGLTLIAIANFISNKLYEKNLW
ncbi:putative multiple-sugar transport system permease YteP [Spirochaetia bacterium]|nr:putative multiple-sugar transport system permease YteP [Spirochaetia bacterium]